MGSCYARDGSRRYEVAPDGKRFLMLEQGGGDDASTPSRANALRVRAGLTREWIEDLRPLVRKPDGRAAVP